MNNALADALRLEWERGKRMGTEVSIDEDTPLPEKREILNCHGIMQGLPAELREKLAPLSDEPPYRKRHPVLGLPREYETRLTSRADLVPEAVHLGRSKFVPLVVPPPAEGTFRYPDQERQLLEAVHVMRVAILKTAALQMANADNLSALWSAGPDPRDSDIQSLMRNGIKTLIAYAMQRQECNRDIGARELVGTLSPFAIDLAREFVQEPAPVTETLTAVQGARLLNALTSGTPGTP